MYFIFRTFLGKETLNAYGKLVFYWYYHGMILAASHLRQTESVNPRSKGLDASAPLEALAALHDGQMQAATVVSSALEQIS